MSEWIPVTERLPEESGCFIVWFVASEDMRADFPDFGDCDYADSAYFNKDQMTWETDGETYNAVLSAVNTRNAYAVTHWMEFPSGPKEREKWVHH